MIALATLASGCGDDTTTTPVGQDLSVPHDLAKPPVVDMAQHD
jgi:hypothetical protein